MNSLLTLSLIVLLLSNEPVLFPDLTRLELNFQMVSECAMHLVQHSHFDLLAILLVELILFSKLIYYLLSLTNLNVIHPV